MRFYLWTLLVTFPGAVSFWDLRTVNGRVCGRFCEEFSKIGLLVDDAE